MGESQTVRPLPWPAWLDEARERRSVALVLRGVRGGGRTTALRTLHDAAAGWRRLHVDASRLERELPYGTVSVLLHRLAAEAPELRGEIDRVEARLFEPAGVERSVALTDLLHLVQRAAASSPVLITVDDAAEGDQRSLEALVFLARRLDRSGVCIALTAQPSAAAVLVDAGLEVVDLPAAEPDRIGALITDRLGGPGPAEVRDAILAYAAGDLLLARALVTALSDEQLAGLASLPVPLPGDDPAARSLLGQLPERTRSALALAALARVDASRVISRALDAYGLGLADLVPAETAGLIGLQAGRVNFANARLRSAAVAGVPPADRRRMHAALAEALAAVASSERAAWVHHLADAALVGDDALVVPLMEVAAAAVADGRPLAAARASADAARWSAPGDPEAEALLTAAVHARAGAASAWAARLLDAAIKAAAAPELRGRIKEEHARLDAFGATPAPALSALLDASAAAESVDTDLAGRFGVSAAAAAFASWAIDSGRAAAERTLTLSRPGSGLHARAGTWCAAFALLAGDIDAGTRELGSHDLSLQHQVDGSSVLARSAGAYGRMLAEDLQGARGSLAALVAELDATGAVGWLPLPLVTLAEVEYRRGWWGASAHHAERARQVAEADGQGVLAGRAHALLARLAAHRGPDAAWVDHVSRARVLAVTTGSDAILALAEVADGLGSLAGGDDQRAALHLAEAQRLAMDAGIGSSSVLWCAGDHLRALIAVDRRDEAAELLADLEVERDAGGGVWLDAAVVRGAAELFPDAVSAAALYGAADALAAVPMPSEQAKVLIVAASQHVQHGDPDAAGAALQRVRPVLESLGARPWIAYAATLGEQIDRLREEEAAPVHSLTTQELRVARLVAGGESNRAVAAALSLSEKTVEYHLHKVYAKLSVPTRGALIRLAAASPFPDPDA